MIMIFTESRSADNSSQGYYLKQLIKCCQVILYCDTNSWIRTCVWVINY